MSQTRYRLKLLFKSWLRFKLLLCRGLQLNVTRFPSLLPGAKLFYIIPKFTPAKNACSCSAQQHSKLFYIIPKFTKNACSCSAQQHSITQLKMVIVQQPQPVPSQTENLAYFYKKAHRPNQLIAERLPGLQHSRSHRPSQQCLACCEQSQTNFALCSVC